MNPIRVLAVGYKDHPSTRLRVQQYEADLTRDGFAVASVLLPQQGHAAPTQYVRELWRLARSADVVLVQRVLLRWLNELLRTARRPIVFDLDDSVQYVRPSQPDVLSHPQPIRSRGRTLYRRVVRGDPSYSSRKRLLDEMFSLCHEAILSNDVLRADLGELCCRTTIIPTAVPALPEMLKRHTATFPITLGWIGTRDNLMHLQRLEPAFEALAKIYADRLRLLVVTNAKYRSEHLQTEFAQWSLAGEPDLVRRFDIGLMPLSDDPFSRGKGAFKAILCMSYGVPVVLSPVGINTHVVREGWNGFLASDREEWVAAIGRLAEDHATRVRLGANAFASVQESFSTAVAYPRLRAVLESSANRRVR